MLATVLWFTAELIFGALIGTIVTIVAFMILTPLLIKDGWLVNKPGKDGPSGPHMFTSIGPGDVKWVIRGKTPIRAIENTGGLQFAREGGDRQVAKYWQIKNTPDEREDLFEDIFWLLRPWARYVFKLTGNVFTGIWPFQKVYEYPLNRSKIVPDDTRVQAGEENAIRIEPVSDWSDHLRNRMSQLVLHIIGAETRDKIPLNFIMIFEGQVSNPFLTAWNNDGWENAVTAYIRSKVIDKVRTMPLNDVLSAMTADKAQAVADAVIPRNKNGTVKKGNPLEKLIGITPIDLKTYQIDAVGTAEQLQMLRAAGFAAQKAEATVTDGRARAEVVALMKNAEGDDGGLALTLEAQVKMTEAAAKGGSLILMPMAGGTTNPIDVAQLDALRRMNKPQQETVPQPGAAPAVGAAEPEGN